MYHERQQRQFCLVHTLNALLQREAFTQQSLDEICYSLNDHRWFNPHRSWLNLGNYDVNVLLAALSLHDLQMSWFDARLPVERIRWEKLKGVIFNVPSRGYIPFWNGRHWFTVLRKDDGTEDLRFVNLDSKLAAPVQLGSVEEFARQLLSRKDDSVQLLLVSQLDSSELVDSQH